MAKLVKLTSNIDHNLLAAVFDLWSWNICRGTHIYILFWAFWCSIRWNRLRNGQVSEIDLQYWPHILTSNIDLDLLAAVCDLRSWNMWRGTHIYILFWALWRIKCWNRLRNGQVTEFDLQYWPRPPSCRVWPLILKHVKRNPHLYFILSIMTY